MSSDLARPRDQRITLLYVQDPIKVNSHPVKFGGRKHSGNVTSTCLITLIWVNSSRFTCLLNLVAIGLSIVTLIPHKKLNSPPRSVILGDFQNQEYRFTIPKFLTRLAANEEKEGDEEHRQLQNVMRLTVGDLLVPISKSSDFISGIFTNCI